MNHTITLEIKAKSEIKIKLRQFKNLIKFDEETHVLKIQCEGKIINKEYGTYYLSGECIEVSCKKINIPTLGNKSLDKIKNSLYVTFYTYKK